VEIVDSLSLRGGSAGRWKPLFPGPSRTHTPRGGGRSFCRLAMCAHRPPEHRGVARRL